MRQLNRIIAVEPLFKIYLLKLLLNIRLFEPAYR